VATPLLALWLPLAATPAPSARLAFAPVCYGGRVAVDRVEVGHLPVAPVEVAPGFHIVEIMCAGRPRWMELVFVTAGEAREVRAEVARPPVPSGAPEGAAGGGAPAEAPPRFEVTGRAGVDARSGPAADDDAVAVTQSWALAYGAARPGGWRATFMPAARHGVAGARDGTRWQVQELRLRSDRLAGFAVGGGRFTEVAPGEAPERVDGGRLDWTRGAWTLAATGLRTADGDDADAVVSGAYRGREAFAEARAAAGTRGARCAATAGVGGLEGWHAAAQGALDGADPTWARLDFGHVGAILAADLGAQWRPDTLDEAPWMLVAPGALFVEPAGPVLSARLAARTASTRVTLDGRGGPGGHRVEGRAFVMGARLEPFVDAASVRTTGPGRIDRWDRLGAGLVARPGSRWRLDLRLGPDRVVGTTLWSAAVGGGFALDPSVWLRASVATAPRRPEGAGDAGRAAVAFVGLEVW
jgi:hypothetical protein